MMVWILSLHPALTQEPPPPVEVVEEPAPAPPTTLTSHPTVLSSGERPRRRLRMRPARDAHWQMQIVRSTTLETDGEARPGPTTTLILDLHQADEQIQLTPDQIDVAGAPLDLLASAQDALRDLAEQASLSAPVAPDHRPWLTAPRADLDEVGDELLHDLIWTLQATTVPFPHTPIGPGAKWTWSRQAEEAGVPLAQEWTATLVERSRWWVTFEVHLTAQTQAEEAQATLHATGQVWMRRDRALPHAARLELTAQLAPDPETSTTPSETSPASMTATIAIATRDVPAR